MKQQQKARNGTSERENTHKFNLSSNTLETFPLSSPGTPAPPTRIKFGLFGSIARVGGVRGSREAQERLQEVSGCRVCFCVCVARAISFVCARFAMAGCLLVLAPSCALLCYSLTQCLLRACCCWYCAAAIGNAEEMLWGVSGTMLPLL